MPRQYIVNSWVGAAEYDEGDTYDGQQIGNRNQKSIGVHITRSGDNWYANTKAYSETESKPSRKPKVKRTAFESICLADSRYNRLQGLLEALEQEHEDGKISWEDFIYARKQLEPRLERAWKQISKYRDWAEDEEDIYSSSETVQYAMENTPKNNVQCGGATSTWVDTLSSENMFKKPIKKALHAAQTLISYCQKFKS